MTSYERGLDFWRSKKVRLDKKGRYFKVDAGNQGTKIIHLYPSPSCSCNGTRICAHIIAVQIAIGYCDEKTKKPNVTQFLKRKRTAADKTSGRKKPRRLDVDHLPQNSMFSDENENTESMDKHLEEEEEKFENMGKTKKGDGQNKKKGSNLEENNELRAAGKVKQKEKPEVKVKKKFVKKRAEIKYQLKVYRHTLPKAVCESGIMVINLTALFYRNN